jgi:peptide/nickel transport system permease protein
VHLLGYLTRRVLTAIVVLFVVATGAFVFFFLGPQDPAAALCGDQRCPDERYQAIQASLGLDEPVLQQYGEFMRGIVTGRELQAGGWTKECPAPCLGYSFVQDRPVLQIMRENIPVTVSIAIGGMAIFVTVGVTIGVLAALNRGTRVDKALVAVSLAVSSVPYYIVAVMAFLVLSAQLGLFPRPGYRPLLTDGPLAWASGLVLAWVVVGLYNSTSYARFARASMVEALGEDFVRTARAKGLSAARVSVRHALRAGIGPVLTILGLDLAGFFGGMVFTEFLFDLKGVGYLALTSVRTGDLPLIMGTVLFGAALVVTVNIVVDLVYGLVDPRVRLT